MHFSPSAAYKLALRSAHIYITMLRSLVFALCVASASAFVASPLAAGRGATPALRSAAPVALVEHAPTVDAASQLLALGLPIPAFTPAKSILMMFCNVLIICTMSIQGKGLSRGTPHDEMVETFGITWLLAGTSLGHIVGAGAILGCEAAGFLS